ncbi:MAG TPA: superoxide dismutase family protein [Methylomirabilota bacterium]|nr:superoxide dismutase family protein [Methylomirabilota bacterium]
MPALTGIVGDGRWPVTLAVILLATGGCLAVLQAPPATATAVLRNARDEVVGTASLAQVTGGVRIVVTVSGLPPGDKGVHIHEMGRCDPPSFASAGGHFNPTRRGHGILNPAGPHVGDLPNMRVDADGTGRLETFTERVTLGTGWNSLLDDARALVIHAAADDHRTDPTGNSGPRLACGVLVKP